MDTLKKLTTLYNPNILFLELGPETISKSIELEAFTLDEITKAHEDYAAFLDELVREWTPEKTKEFVLAYYRHKCETCLKKISELEITNHDARRNGVSYKDRQSFTVKINAGRQVFAESKQKGVYYSKRKVSATDFITPGDVKLIMEWGYEKWLKYRLI
jgi:hypothetical protein